jgi:glutamyl-tRNA synthetase
MPLTSVRTRFAPSPTGFMHLGNVRAALICYFFAKQKKGTFYLRIEDTDMVRNIHEGTSYIFNDLTWMSITYDEGPVIGGPYGPYFQSQRTSIYQEYLQKLLDNKQIYRCFCTIEELEKKRTRQIALKQPPRYDRTCLHLTQAEIEEKLAAKTPYIWRFALPDTTITVTDMARGTLTYELHNFSDFPLTRQDGSFTFLFSNVVDDILMKTSHIFRGEEHSSNTGVQAALYQAFNQPIPIFWHLPVICNHEGKKLSKRDFGFSLNDLKKEGYLPEAIANYLLIIGSSHEQEIMSLEEFITNIPFEKIISTGHIQYDVAKLQWVNHQWIKRLSLTNIAQRVKPFLLQQYPQALSLTDDQIMMLVKPFAQELTTLQQISDAMAFYFSYQFDVLKAQEYGFEKYHTTIDTIMLTIKPTTTPPELVAAIAHQYKQDGHQAKEFYHCLRVVLTGLPLGPSISDIITILGTQETKKRLQQSGTN